MALRRCTRHVDGTIPVYALLYDDEELLASQGNVGIYDGTQKSPNHQAGTIHVSTHRLFYVDTQNAFAHSFGMDLSYVTRTEYYAGLFRSSPKVTLYLSAGSSTASGSGTAEDTLNSFESWECEVCAYRNPPGLSPAAARICALCGVPRSAVPTDSTSGSSQHHLSSSLPSSSVSSALASSTSLSAASHITSTNSVACPACTFLNYSSMEACEICSTPLPRSQDRIAMKSAPSSRPPSPDEEDDSSTNCIIKLSFRKGGDKPFYAVLRRSLKSKAWQNNGIGSKPQHGIGAMGTGPNPSQGMLGSGIDRILRTVESSAQSKETGMQDALHDLEALMVKAKDMVRLAGELNEQLTASSTIAASAPSLALAPSAPTLIPSTEPEEATFIRSSLSQLGLQMPNAPVTLDMMKDESKWMQELARELTRILQGSVEEDPRKSGEEASGMMKERGIIALDEVWGGWNRARGVALIPPSTFLSVLPHLPTFTKPPIRTRTFVSGLMVLHTPPYTHAAFAARLVSLLALDGPKTTIEVAQEVGVTVGLAGEMIEAVEEDGDVCRDDPGSSIKGSGGGGGAQVRWWANVFQGYVWDGQTG